MNLSNVSIETVWLFVTEYIYPWTIARHFVIEIVIFMLVDLVVKNFLDQARNVQERYRIWLVESLVLLLISGILAVTYHKPYILWFLTVSTFCYATWYGRKQNNKLKPVLRKSDESMGSSTETLTEESDNEVYTGMSLKRTNIHQNRKPLHLGRETDTGSSDVTGRSIASTSKLNINEKRTRVKSSISLPTVSYHSNNDLNLKNRFWSCLGYDTLNALPGLANNGQNVCFMNSVLQCLAHTPSLAAMLRNQMKSAIANQSEMAFLKAMGNLLEFLNVTPGASKGCVVSACVLRSAIHTLVPSLIADPDYGFQLQQDAAEFLTWLLCTLQQILNRKGNNQLLTPTTGSAAANMETMLQVMYGDISENRISELIEHYRNEIEHGNEYEDNSEAENILALSNLEWLCYCRRNTSIIDDIFTGQLADARHCLTCSRISVSIEPFTVLPVPIAESYEVDGPQVNLQHCFEKFSYIEELSGQDSLACTCKNLRKQNQETAKDKPKRRSERIKKQGNQDVSDGFKSPDNDTSESSCNARASRSESISSDSRTFTPGQRRTLLSKVPQCLVIQLMRFHYDARNHTACKKHTAIQIPVTDFDLKDLVFDKVDSHETGASSRHIYDLCGVCIHQGGQIASYGHYIAYCQAVNNEWYKFDDSHVTLVQDMVKECNSPEVKENAYILFYKKR